jgi:hypothetical protein
MCDALSANVPKAIQTILSHCLSHGFRKFDELRDYFPAECLVITRLLSRVFKYDSDTQHHTKVAANPAHWLPWNYQDTIASMASDANLQA